MNISNSTPVEWDSIKRIHLITEVIIYIIAFTGNLLKNNCGIQISKIKKNKQRHNNKFGGL